MKLVIENLAKIASATLEFNGITVIVGDNNTGKTTIGKALYTLFAAFSSLDKKVKESRKINIGKILRLPMFLRPRYVRHSSIIDELLDVNNSPDAVREILKKRMSRLNQWEDNISNAEIHELAEKVIQIRNLSDDTLKVRIIGNTFSNVFGGQYRSLIDKECYPRLELFVKEKKNTVELKSEIGYDSEVNLTNQAYFLSGTNVLQHMNRRYYSFDMPVSEFDANIAKQVSECMNDRMGNATVNAVPDAILQENLKKINQIFKSVVNGEIVQNDDGEFIFKNNDFGIELRLSNLSEGLKPFALLQLILGLGLLKNKDVLILDEPEVHLHPEWQAKFAEIIVLLQKYLDLTILLTTHSSDFIYALQLYAKKHKIEDKLNAYKSEVNDGKAYIKPIKDSDEIYARFAAVISKLDDLEEELRHGESV